MEQKLQFKYKPMIIVPPDPSVSDHECSDLSDDDELAIYEKYCSNDNNECNFDWVLNDGQAAQGEFSHFMDQDQYSTTESSDLCGINKEDEDSKSLVLTWTDNDLPNIKAFEPSCWTIHEQVQSPLQYFYKFFTEGCISYIVEQTNLYSFQKMGKSIDLAETELKDFLGMTLIMGIIKLPTIRDYWSNTIRIPQVADVMSRDRYNLIKQNLHFVDNSEYDDTVADKFFKIRKLLNFVSEACNEQQNGNTNFSVNEKIIPFKGTFHDKYYSSFPSAPQSGQCGFKIYELTGSNKIVFNFILYQGETTFSILEDIDIKLTEDEKSKNVNESIVYALCKSIQNPAGSVIYCNSSFSSIKLFLTLRDKYGIFAVGAFDSDKINKCPLKTDQALKNEGLGSYDFKSSDDKLIIAKYFDNKSVIIGSTIYGIYPISMTKRSRPEDKKIIKINYPNIVKKYNSNLIIAEKSDYMNSLYKISSKSKRWYIPIFNYILKLCVSNAWHLYKKDIDVIKNVYNKEKVLNLKEFRLSIAQGLIYAGKPVRDLPDINIADKKNYKRKRKNNNEDVQYDNTGHWPVFVPPRNRCKFCIKGIITTECVKCNVKLCCNSNKNCFLAYHTKNVK